MSGVENSICNENVQTDPDGHVVQGVGLRGLACWDCGFEYRRRQRYICCVCCVLPE
jgi:hypothetical protein